MDYCQCRLSLIIQFTVFLSRCSRQRERLSASELSICSYVCLFVCLSVCLSPKCKKSNAKKRDFLKKLSNLKLWSLITTYSGWGCTKLAGMGSSNPTQSAPCGASSPCLQHSPWRLRCFNHCVAVPNVAYKRGAAAR